MNQLLDFLTLQFYQFHHLLNLTMKLIPEQTKVYIFEFGKHFSNSNSQLRLKSCASNVNSGGI